MCQMKLYRSEKIYTTSNHSLFRMFMFQKPLLPELIYLELVLMNITVTVPGGCNYRSNFSALKALSH